MSFLKLELSIPELRRVVQEFKKSRIKALEAMSEEIKTSFAQAMDGILNAEMELFLGEAEQRDNKRNGYQSRTYTFKGLGTLKLRMPQDRKRRFASSVIPKRERLDPRVKEDIAALHLGGLSTRTLSMMSRRILGIEVSHEMVSESLPLLAGHAKQWLQRPIEGDWWALLVDGTNFKVTRRGSTEKEPMLVVLGIDQQNRRSILAVEPGFRDNAESWRYVFRGLKQRGLDFSKVKIGVMDGLPGLEKVFLEEFPEAVTARCWFHALQNILAKAPKRLRDPLHSLVKKVMYAKDDNAAREAFSVLESTLGNDCSRAIDCLRKDLDSLLAHYRFPERLRRALKTTNAVERVHKEFKRRSRSMEGMGEVTLSTLVAFTALRLEMGWQRRGVDTFEVDHLIANKKKINLFQDVMDGSIVH